MALRFFATELYSLATEALTVAYEAASRLSDAVHIFKPIPETPVLGAKIWGTQRSLMHSFSKENDGFFFESVRKRPMNSS